MPPVTGSPPVTITRPSGADRSIRQSANATTAEIDGQLVALDMDTGTCFGLNPIATHIWHLIETPASAHQVVQALLQDYDVAPDICAAQVADLMHELVEIGLATPAEQD